MYFSLDIKEEEFSNKNTHKKKDKFNQKNDATAISGENSTDQKGNICANINNSSTKLASVNATNGDKNKQIMNALPQELINRIRESGKRKCISVIEPIVPNKKQRIARTLENSPPTIQNKASSFVVPNTVQLDHDYCYNSNVPRNDKKKDSGFESAEEDERTVIEKQPMVKNADGKLMVSLLKVCNIHKNVSSSVPMYSEPR